MSEVPPRPFDRLSHLPGPNPILTPGPGGAWDDRLLEACDVLRDHGRYYLFYHATSATTSYRIGVVTADHPLGPWRREGEAPALPLGEPGAWDDQAVACAALLKEGAGRYLMFYSANSTRDPAWGIGLATAEHPLGPWTKHPANPLLPGFGYVGGAVRTADGYRLYVEHPIGSRGPDYGPLSMATAPAPEGPWTPHAAPILRPGEWGEWDDGGFSEAKVIAQDGLYHLFYGGARLHPVRLSTEESIGYAWSRDGERFTKHPANPVAPREAEPDAAAFAEVHAHLEPPLVYLFHTLRYHSRPDAEDLGVQVLAMGPCRVPYPVLTLDRLAPGQTTPLEAGPPIPLGPVTGGSLTVRFTAGPEADVGVYVHLFASADGRAYDTEPLPRNHLHCPAGQTIQATFELPCVGRFLRCRLQNASAHVALSDVSMTATLALG